MRLTRSKPKRRKRRRSRRYEAAVPGVRPRLRPVVGAWRGRLDAVPSVFLLVALGWLAGQFFITDKFYVHEITVVGNQFVSAEEIFSASELAGLSIFWVDPARVEAAIARLPGIKEARSSGSGMEPAIGLTRRASSSPPGASWRARSWLKTWRRDPSGWGIDSTLGWSSRPSSCTSCCRSWPPSNIRTRD